MSFDWLGFVPIWAVRLGVILVLLTILLWMKTLPSSYVYRDAPDDAWWRDVRWWACVIFAILGITTLVL